MIPPCKRCSTPDLHKTSDDCIEALLEQVRAGDRAMSALRPFLKAAAESEAILSEPDEPMASVGEGDVPARTWCSTCKAATKTFRGMQEDFTVRPSCAACATPRDQGPSEAKTAHDLAWEIWDQLNPDDLSPEGLEKALVHIGVQRTNDACPHGKRKTASCYEGTCTVRAEPSKSDEEWARALLCSLVGYGVAGWRLHNTVPGEDARRLLEAMRRREARPETPALDEKVLLESLEWLYAVVVHEVELPKSHEGSCHPDAGCDGACSDAYYHGLGMTKVWKLIQALKARAPMVTGSDGT